MGHDATVTKKVVLGKVLDAITAANKACTRADKLTELHTAFVDDVKTRHTEHNTRLNSQGEWIEQVEGTADAASALAQELDERFAELINEVGVLRVRQGILLDLTVWGRVKLLFGVLPDLPLFSSPVAFVAGRPSLSAMQGIERASGQPGTVVTFTSDMPEGATPIGPAQ